MKIINNRIAGADGLRALACLLVVWHHTAQKFNPEGSSPLIKALHYLGMRGEVGVSLFFVLSGCLLSLPFWSAFLNKQNFPSIKRYTLNRSARIAPAFWMNLIFCNALAVLAFNIDFSWTKFISAFFFVNSYHYSTFFPAELNGPLWSIGLEVSCYLLLPIMLFSIVKFTKTFFSAMVAMFALITTLQLLNPLIINIFMTDNYRKGWEYGQIGGAKLWLPYWNVASFFSQFLIGSMAALVILWMKLNRTGSRRTFDLGCVATFATAVLLVVARLQPGSPDSLSQQPYLSPYYALLMGIALVLLSHSVYLHRVLDNQVLVWISKLSFSIYLWHVVVMEIISRQFLPSYVYFGLDEVWEWIFMSLLILITSIAIAAASWRWVEAPILKITRSRFVQSAPLVAIAD